VELERTSSCMGEATFVWVGLVGFKYTLASCCSVHVRKLGKFRYILILEIINTFMTNISDPVRAKHVLVFKLNLK
jgi:hypothetical protein